MNKVLIIALAVCLVSVHAFVKRDADKPTATTGEDITVQAKKLFDETSAKVGEFFNSDPVKDALDTEKLKKNLEKALEDIKNAFTPEKKE